MLIRPQTPGTTIGILANPRSHAFARHKDAIAAAAQHTELLVETPGSHAALADALSRFRQAGARLIILNGGDGTLRDVLTALPLAYPMHPPEIALLPAGNTNLAARALGSAGHHAKALHALLAAARSGTLRHATYPILAVTWRGQPDRPALRGLFFGAAAYPEAKRIADAHIHRHGLYSGYAVGLTLALTFLRTLFGGHALRHGTHLSLGLDDDPPQDRRRFLVLATTLNRMALGLWPFWGEGAGNLHWLDIDAPPPRLAAALLAVLRHRPRPWMHAAGYRSGRATRLTIGPDKPFVLDGEFFDTGRNGIVLAASGAITFVRP